MKISIYDAHVIRSVRKDDRGWPRLDSYRARDAWYKRETKHDPQSDWFSKIAGIASADHSKWVDMWDARKYGI